MHSPYSILSKMKTFYKCYSLFEQQQQKKPKTNKQKNLESEVEVMEFGHTMSPSGNLLHMLVLLIHSQCLPEVFALRRKHSVQLSKL